MKTRSAKVKAEPTVAAPAATRRSTRLQAKAEPKEEPVTATTVPAAKAKKNAAKRKSPTKTKSSKRRKTGIKGTVDTTALLGVVDPESNLEGEILVDGSEQLDAMLLLVDPSKNMDKYYVLQLVVLDKPTVSGAYVVYTRWGRTGTTGQALTETFEDEETAVEFFNKKFEEKSGLNWEQRLRQPIVGQYRFVPQNFAAKQSGYADALWQYWVGDGVDGKSTGWYPYDYSASAYVEQLFHEQPAGGALRFVASGSFVYIVNLNNYIQTNCTTQTTRFIRRFHKDGTVTPAGWEIAPTPVIPQNHQPVNFGQTKPNVSARSTAKPSHTVVKPPPAIVPNPVKQEPKEEEAVAEEEDSVPKLRPVDTAIEITGNSADDFQLVSNEFDITLNQCNITGGNNNNKYYRIQLLVSKDGSSYYTWTRWGRVGEEARSNTSKLMGPYDDVARAQKEFEKKWKDKTGNLWSKRDDFVPNKGKYEPVIIDTEAEPMDIDSKKSVIKTTVKKEYEPSKLDSKTRELIEVIHSTEIMEAQMLEYDIDVKKMPLGTLDQAQVQRGAEILDEMKDALKRKADSNELSELTSRFYTAIPHSFGRSRPPVIQDEQHLQSKFDMLDVLLDIESTTSKIEEMNKRNAEVETEKLPHPADQKYDGLGAKLRLVDPSEPNHAVVMRYFEKTKHHDGAKLLNVWEIDRNGEGERFEEYAALDNHRLLWHGTGIAVVAAILGSGLRIMPHSGGRVGKGIYLANEMSKSAGYTHAYGSKYACMFLAEAALGRMKEITQDDSSLTKAPKSFHSVLAKGTQSPQEYVDTKIDGRDVAVPQNEPVENGIQSWFNQDEYLVYDEAQVRLRYVCTVDLGY